MYSFTIHNLKFTIHNYCYCKLFVAVFGKNVWWGHQTWVITLFGVPTKQQDTILQRNFYSNQLFTLYKSSVLGILSTLGGHLGFQQVANVLRHILQKVLYTHHPLQ